MLADVAKVVTEDAESKREVADGFGVVARVSSLCSRMTVGADPEVPSFFDMCSEKRMIGGSIPRLSPPRMADVAAVT